MIKKLLILSLFFYLLVLLQTSFLVHFKIAGLIPNFVFISVILLNILERPRNHFGLYAGFIGGLFLDIFSSGIIGLYVLILLGSAFLIKIILRKYVWSPIS